MGIRKTPRKATDRGGFACMPLKKNIDSGRKGWKLTTCPECKRKCWETPMLKYVLAQGSRALCTECCIKKARWDG